MKKAVMVLMAVCHYVFAAAQSPDCHISVSVDSATGLRKAEAPFTVIAKENDNLFCTAFRSGSTLSIYFGLEIWNKNICFKPGSRAIVIFTDLSQLQLTSVQAFNCKGNFLVNLNMSDSDFNQKNGIYRTLSGKIIKGIRFYSTQGFVDYDVAEDNDEESARNADRFRQTLVCLKEMAL